MATTQLRRSARTRNHVKSDAEKPLATERNQQGRPMKRRHEPDNEAVPSPPNKAKRIKKSPSQSKTSRTKATPAKPDGPTPRPSKPRPRIITSTSEWHESAAQRRILANNARIRRVDPGTEEKRLRSYRDIVPDSHWRTLQRANTQRMFILNRERGVEDNCHANHSDCPFERVQIAGSTGNVYTVTISHLPSCTCPVGIFTKNGKEQLCKHTLYVLHNVLKAPETLTMQTALLTTELKQLFCEAPAMPSDTVQEKDMDGHRKPIEDDCAICCMEFGDIDSVVWCRAACGNNLHKACFDKWAETKARVTCPYCRSNWQYDMPKIAKVNVTEVVVPTNVGGGYRNVLDQLDYD